MSVNLIKEYRAFAAKNPALAAKLEAAFGDEVPQMEEHKNGHRADESGLVRVGDKDGTFALFEKDRHTGRPKQMLGYAFRDSAKQYYAFMGACFCGVYQTADDAVTNIIVAYYG